MKASKLVWSVSVAAVNGVSGRNRVENWVTIATSEATAGSKRAANTTPLAASAAGKTPVTPEYR